MEEETEFKKLSVEDRCVHKLWKARIHGYEECIKIFSQIDDEKSTEWNKFLGLIKKFVADSNAAAMEKGLEATLIFIENCGSAGKTAGEVVPVVIQKGIAAPRTKTKELSLQIILMYVEIEKHEFVVEELLKGMEHKNPKIVAACITTTTQALKEFGQKVISVKPLIKKLQGLLTDRDKAIRDEGKLLAIEINRWIGPVMKSQISSLPAVLLTELENEFEKLKGEKAEPIRFFKSQQQKQHLMSAAISVDGDGNSDEQDGESAETELLDLVDPVEILSKIPKDFYEKLEAKKWTERKEALEALEKLLDNPKLEAGEYGDLVRALKKVLTKDTNVILVAMAGKCIGSLAKGLGKRFSTYATACVQAILEKFKEKKTNVVTALRDAIDVIYQSTTIESIQEDIVEALNNKNPNVKAETASFLARAFARTRPVNLNKKSIKLLVTTLIKTLNEPDPIVRDASASALGTLSKLLGEKAVSVYFAEIDALKMAKVKEYQEKAEIFVKVPSNASKPKPSSATVKQGSLPQTEMKSKTSNVSTDAKGTSKPIINAFVKKSAPKKSNSNAAPLSRCSSSGKVPSIEKELSPDDVTTKAEELLSTDILTGLSDANWKTRLQAVENMLNFINKENTKVAGMSQVLIRTISSRKPGLKEMNFQVLKVKLEIIKTIAENIQLSTTSVEFIINEVTEKLADPKNSSIAAETLTSLAEATKFEFVVCKILSFAFMQKSPKVQSEALNWIGNAIREFGFQINPKSLLEDVKKAIQSTNPTVRTAGISLLGVVSIYMGSNIIMFFDNEKPALKQQIQSELDKYIGTEPPQPIRGVKKSASISSINEAESSNEVEQQLSVADLFPRSDISSQITEALLADISDKDWKTRNEGLMKLQNILNEAKFIKPTIGDLPQALLARLMDSNAKIAQTAFAICEQLASAMGPSCKVHARFLFPAFLHGLGDSKVFIRSASLSCINIWGEQCGYKEFFEGEMIADSLKTGSPALKSELWSWLAVKLPNIPVKSVPKEELAAMLPSLYANISDRNADVRKNANEAILGIMIHLGYETMVKALEKQKPSSKKDIQAALEKTRPNLPIKPLPKTKQVSVPVQVVKSQKGQKLQLQNAKNANNTDRPLSSRKKEEDIDTSPLLAENKMKNQRLIDEQKLKVIRWKFTTPSEEFYSLLREQLTAANVNRNLIANMFHDDFRYHLKAVDSLTEDLLIRPKAAILNLDLLLKWMSLRFYDTNPSVILKILDYLNILFKTVVEAPYVLSEMEANCFIPHLLVKIGDPKDAVRNGVRSVLRQIYLIYPGPKLTAFLMEALKSKNARVRAECLEEVGYLIVLFNLCETFFNVQNGMKEIARHISDRDNSVRNAALNCVVQAYYIAGDKVYKMIGQINEKDQTMLEERIKRARKSRTSVTVEPPIKPSAQAQENIEIEDPEPNELPPPEEVPTLQQTFPKTSDQIQSQAAASPKSAAHCGLDPSVVAEIEKNWVRSSQMKPLAQSNVDLSFLYEPIRIVTKDGVGYPQDKFEKLLSQTAKPLTPLKPNSADSQSPSIQPTLIKPQLDPKLVEKIKQMASTDSMKARATLIEFSDILDSPERRAALRDYEEILMESALEQFKILSQQPIDESLKVYQPLLAIIYAFFNSDMFGKLLSVLLLKDIMSAMLGLMADQRLSTGENVNYTKVINGICLKVLDKSDFTNINCALIRLLKETCLKAGLPKFLDLLMKCLWRNVKVMPDRENELDYESVLLELHEFMLALPTTWWHQRPSDTPMRTVKTIIHNMVRIKKSHITKYLTRIPKNSELITYTTRILRSIQKEDAATAKAEESEKPTISMEKVKKMTQIIRLLTRKETTDEGIKQLYEFQEQHPGEDICQYASGITPGFMKYIKKILANFGKSQQADGAAIEENDQQTFQSRASIPLESIDLAEVYAKRYEKFMEKAHMYENYKLHDPIDNKMVEKNLNANKLEDNASKYVEEKVPHHRLDDIRQKLAEIKQLQESS